MSFGYCRENVLSVFIKVKEPFSQKMYIESVKTCLHALLLCMLCFHVCTRVCFNLISNVHIVRAFEIEFQFKH